MTEKIIVIDDDASLRRVLEYNLVEEGYTVATASNGRDGVALFEEEAADLVITDLKMSGMDGFQVLKAVKEKNQETQVVVITAFGAVETAVQAMKNGAFDYITKPFNRDELKLTVKKALQVKRLESENRQLRNELSDQKEFRNIIGISRQIARVFEIVAKVADTDATVLITGESGTGKELVARAIHAGSSRRDKPFIAINCAAIPHDLLESELFGHVKGSFTGAIRDKAGKFQQADLGTIFLDEVGELPVDLQPKLLRALQEKMIEVVGGGAPQKVDVRVVAATNADLEQAIQAGAFREDLYYRLAVIPIQLPPLRERTDDVPLLIKHFIDKHNAHGVSISPAAMALLQNYPWPGNVRELENTVERLLIMRNSDVVDVADLPDKIRKGKHQSDRIINLPQDGYSLEQLEKEIVVEALEKNGWNQTNAAKFLQIPRHTLIYRMEKYGIVPEGKRK